ncbi:hypothetical protein QEN19_003502 [Hanseniaspora menglaensis]
MKSTVLIFSGAFMFTFAFSVANWINTFKLETNNTIYLFKNDSQISDKNSSDLDIFLNDEKKVCHNNRLVLNILKNQEDLTPIFATPKFIKISQRALNVALKNVYLKYPQLENEISLTEFNLDDMVLCINPFAVI